ncbi:MAG: NAD(P)H-binding protein [Bacteroidia bacterium]|nr:NAD(P)H-binding protein [Bacteroidia bacterium]
MEGKTAILFGATGLVGNLLLEELTKSKTYSTIRIFVRQTTGISLPGVEEIITDFSGEESLSGKIKGDDLYVCLGTTIKKAGSIANMEKIDRDLPVMVAAMAKNNGVRGIAVVSSIGATAASKNYYLRIKGEMEEKIQKLGFEKSVIVRPSMLLGDRKERRTGEFLGKVMIRTFQPVLTGKLMKFRAIHGRDVAKAMISLLQGEPGNRIVESDELLRIAKGN